MYNGTVTPIRPHPNPVPPTDIPMKVQHTAYRQQNLPHTPLVAIDFETADYGADSACAVGLARVENGRVVDTLYSLIRPPRRRILFTWVHGITWEQVRDSPTFAELWPQLASFWEGATGLVAHNAPFDRRVLLACCEAAHIPQPELPFVCTLRESRRRLHLPSYRLDSLCDHCGIPLDHHHAGSDALAAARLFIYLQQLDATESQEVGSGRR